MKKTLIALGAALASVMIFSSADTISAAVSVESINYDTSTIVINPDNNKKVLISDGKQKTWETLDVKNNGKVELDISWISAAKEYTLSMKGDTDKKIETVVIPAYNKSIKVKYNKNTGLVEFNNVGSSYDSSTSFRWRKGVAYAWNENTIDIEDFKQPSASAVTEPNAAEFLTVLENCRLKGTSIYVQTVPVNYNSNSNLAESTNDIKKTLRPSKEIKVSIAKKPAPPNVSINGSKLTLGTTTKMEYWDDSNNKWESTEKGMPISEIASKVIAGTSNGEDEVVKIRTAKTDKKEASSISLISIPGQRPAPNNSVVSMSAITTDKKGKKSFKFNIPDASTNVNNIYEYTIVKENKINDVTDNSGNLIVSKVKWTTVNKNTKFVTLKETSIPAGSKLYVRKKLIKANKNKNIEFELASDYVEINITY